MTSAQQTGSYAASVSATATLQTLVTFNGTDGATPRGGLIVDAAGSLYGTTYAGGSFGYGTVFEIADTAAGYSSVPSTLVTFEGNKSNGFYPSDNLAVDSKGDLFGTTFGLYAGRGPFALGSVFELKKTQTGFAKPTTLLHFRQYGGYYPGNSLTLDSNGDIFGTARGPVPKDISGEVYELGKTAAGYRAQQTVLARFGTLKTQTSVPASNLVLDPSGNLFGATSIGGTAGNGEVFELAKVGQGYSPKPVEVAAVGGVDYLAADKAGNIFGTSETGSNGYGSVFEVAKSGSGYTTTTLGTFDNANGADPGSVAFDAAGDIYGTTYTGGAYGKGTVFELAKTATGYGPLTTLYSFTGGADGAGPTGYLSFDAAGHIFGTTTRGGTSNDGTVFELTAAGALCFCAGTRIRTVSGDVAVEALTVADVVVTASGAHRAVTWLGHRRLERPGWNAQPVRVAAHAFGEGRPARDLWLSPGHPVLVGADADATGGCLVPIMCLVNGTTIERIAVDEVDYWHVELEAHDILLAEGLAAESYLDWGDRPFFDEGADHALANPDFVVPGLAGRCRPVAIDGAVVEMERRRLDALFGLSLAAACAWPQEAAQAFRADLISP